MVDFSTVAIEVPGGATTDTTNAPSASIWGDCPFSAIRDGVKPGIAQYYDTFPLIAAGAQAVYGADWHGFGSTGGGGTDASEAGGVLQLASDGDDEGASIAQQLACYQLTRDAGRFWMEARIKTSTIADTKHGIFIGMIGAATLSATVPLTAAGALSDDNKVGFHRLEADGDKLDTVYKADGVTAVTVKADASTLVADTWTKVGLKLNSSGVLYWYVDGVRLPDSKTLPDATGTDFPADVRMRFVMAVLNATATTPGNSEIDWVKIAQLAEDDTA